MNRVAWNEVPDDVRAALAARIGAPVVEVAPRHGGFSPCLAASLGLDDGRRVFVKAVSSAQNPFSPSLVRREIATLERLPAAVPAPRLLASYDDGTWVAGVFEHVDGDLPSTPWQGPELKAALHALSELSATAAPGGLEPAGDRLGEWFDGWRRLVDDRSPADGWWRDHLTVLARLEVEALEGASGDRLVHADVRSDNVLIDAAHRVTFVDWAHTCVGAGWLDLVLWLPALELEGGGRPEEVLDRVSDLFSLPSGDALTAVVAGLAGFFLHRSTLPAPPGLPTLRSFQRAQATTALAWLARRLGIASP